MAKIWVLQNAPPENLGIIGQILQNYGLEPAYVRTFAGEEVPRYMESAVGLVVLGGPMSVYEHNRYPFITGAMRLIDQALKEQKPVLGICLGSQIIAAALGASVTRGAKKFSAWPAVTAAGQKTICVWPLSGSKKACSTPIAIAASKSGRSGGFGFSASTPVRANTG